MPLYDIECKECGEIFEVEISLSEFDDFKDGHLTVTCHDPNVKGGECASNTKEIIISGLKTRHKSWWNWRDITK